MLTTLKILGLSAVLAAGLVAASLPTGASVPTGKAFTERLPEAATAPLAPRPASRLTPTGDALRDGPADSCARAVWPYLPRDCFADGRRPVRTIAIEPRDASNNSTLVRVPAPRVAAR